MANVTNKYTLVQHSGFGYGDKSGFEHAVEVRQLYTTGEVALVAREGGVIFNSYAEADNAEMRENYPREEGSIYPNARGTFSDQKIDGLRIYLPPTQSADKKAVA